MVKTSLLFISVATLFLFMIPGFLLRKFKLAGDDFAKSLSVLVLYVAQSALFIHGFIIKFNKETFKGVIYTFIFALITHLVFSLISLCLFKKAPEKRRKVLQFAVVFSNAGYMGIPVIADVLGNDFVIYATAYTVWFNAFAYSFGRLLYTGDKKYMSLKKIIVNPAIISILIGMAIYFSGLGAELKDIMASSSESALKSAVTMFYNILTVLKNMVAPASMMVIGARIADIDLRGVLKDRYLYRFLGLRHFVFPFIMWCIMRPFLFFGVIGQEVISIILILCSTPAAAMTSMFAELYAGDSPYAGKIVAVSTLVSVISMPLVSLLLYI